MTSPRRQQEPPLFLAAFLFAAVFTARLASLPLIRLAGLGLGTLLCYALTYGALPLVLLGRPAFLRTIQAAFWGESVRSSPFLHVLRGTLTGLLNYLPCLALANAAAAAAAFFQTPADQDSAASSSAVRGIFEAASGGSLGWMDTALLALSLLAAAPLFEELFFRGTLQPLAASRLPWTAAVFLTALAFALIHLDGLPNILPRLELGVVLGLLAARSGSVLPAAAAHAAHNALGILANALERSSTAGERLPLQLDGTSSALLIGASVLSFALMCLILARTHAPQEGGQQRD